MTVDFFTYITSTLHNPVLLLIVILNIGVIIINGATDAPNAIATAVSTRSIKPRHAILMAATGNFLGLVVVSFLTTAVAHTITNLVSFGGDDRVALISLAAAMVAIIVWGVVTWWFGIPSSQSHSLIAGLTGAAIAAMNSFSAINWDAWGKVIWGIALSTILGFTLGWAFSKIIAKLFAHTHRGKINTVFKWAQICSGAGVAFMHGAQDGQKFMSIFLLGYALTSGLGQSAQMLLPIWLMVFSALNIGLGTAIGGERIIKNVAGNMVKLETYQGFASSFSSFISLIIATFTGMPVSTTHCNTTAIMGAAASKKKSAVRWQVAIDMVKTWILTFPGCGLIGFVMAKLFLLFV
ncbi:MAG: inorganic phosphate transporter [Eggerthellaceae bacterium]|nr:inorganic phosphate transporter [Eggerthellaceae bacterium]